MEFAGIFAGLGARTTLVYRGDLFLRGFDDSVRAFVKEEIQKKHINLLFNNNVAQIDEEADAQGQSRYTLTMADGSQHTADLVLYATGRKPKTAGLGLENAGVALGDNGKVLVDEYYRTSAENIYAIGDVTDRVQLTPVAIEEGMCIANNLFTDKSKKHLNYQKLLQKL